MEAPYPPEIGMYQSGALEGIAVSFLSAETPESRHNEDGGVIYTLAYTITMQGCR